MARFHLISHHLCPYVQRAAIVLAEKGVSFERTYVDLTDKPRWFLKISPLGRVPLLETGGEILFESQVIAEYLDEITDGSLHPPDPLQKAKQRSWIEFGSATLNVIAGLYNAKTASEFAKKNMLLADRLQRIEAEIKLPYFFGEQFHMVDGVWGTIWRYFEVFEQIEEFDAIHGSEILSKWRLAVMARPSVIKASLPDYASRLQEFLKNRDGYISTLI